MKRKIFRKSFIATMTVAAVFATCAAAGETVTAEPDALLDYIEATGAQYINTGVNAEIGLKASIDFTWATFSGNPDWSFLDAATVSAKSDNRSRIFLCHMYNGKPFFAYGLKQRRNPANSVSFVGGQRCEIITDMSSTNSFELIQNGGTLIVDLGRLNGAAALSGEGRAELKINGGSLELIGDTATYDGNTYMIASGFGKITSAWTNTCVSGQAEGTNVRYEVRHDDTSVRVSVICDEEPYPEPNPTPDPGPVVPATYERFLLNGVFPQNDPEEPWEPEEPEE